MESPDSFNHALVSFTLNRQFRTWPLSYQWEGDTLRMVCKQTAYAIPRHVVDGADRFSWLTPQFDGTRYQDVAGTFLFISHRALRQLKHSGAFEYDHLTWRQVDATAEAIHVRADVDDCEMWISLVDDLPLVLEMRGNKLGIDWKIKNDEKK